MIVRNKKKRISDATLGEKKVDETMIWANDVKLLFNLDEETLKYQKAEEYQRTLFFVKEALKLAKLLFYLVNVRILIFNT